MLLVQCKCGNYATLDSDFFSRRLNFKCPNCQSLLAFTESTEIQHMERTLASDEFKIYALPDDATLEFNFSVSKSSKN